MNKFKVGEKVYIPKTKDIVKILRVVEYKNEFYYDIKVLETDEFKIAYFIREDCIEKLNIKDAIENGLLIHSQLDPTNPYKY